MTAREVNPVQNLVAIGEFVSTNPAVPQGVAAAGDGQFTFRLNATGQPSQVVGPLAATAGDTPLQTAQKLAALVQTPYTAEVSQNPARFVDPPNQRSADILLRVASGADVTVDQESSTDSRQNLLVGRPNPLALQSWDGTNFLVGSLEQRTLLKNYDTGDDRVDVLVVGTLTSGNLGEAMMSGHRIDPQRSAIAKVKFSAFVVQSAMDGTDVNPTAYPHECGHVAMELVHAVEPAGRHRQLMTDQPVDSVAVDGTKRIKETPQRFDRPAGNFRQLQEVNANGATLLEPF
jgi:hypothetical protein